MTVSIDTVKPALMSQKATINDFREKKKTVAGQRINDQALNHIIQHQMKPLKHCQNHRRYESQCKFRLSFF